MNQLFYGDNLHVLRDRAHFPDASVDLIYLDPPFNSKRDYNLLFKSPKGRQSEAQLEAFKDTWHWADQAEKEHLELLKQSNTEVALMMDAFLRFVGRNDMMAYLTMMASRLLELRRVLAPTGSLYLHCDPTASHYLKLLLDAVFGKENFRSEVIWKRSGTHSSANRWGPVHDVIFFYTKSAKYTWNRVYGAPNAEHMARHYRHRDEQGRHYAHGELTAPGTRNGRSGAVWKGFDVTAIGRHWMTTVEKLDALLEAGRIYMPGQNIWPRLIRYEDENEGGRAIGDVWTDIPPINMRAAERLGYPTQKPVALLLQIIQASSNRGDVVLDPFCGCGTAVHAAQMLKREWIGIDITHLAISLIEKRLKDAFGKRCEFTVEGTPGDLEAARDLSIRDRYQFQYWAVSLVNANPAQNKKKGADGGVDGIKFFRDLDQKDAHKVVVSVKSGKLKPDDIRALMAVRAKENAEIALLVTLDEPSPKMTADAASAGFYKSAAGKNYPRVQILTIAGLLAGTQCAAHPDYEPDLNQKKAKAEAHGEQPELL